MTSARELSMILSDSRMITLEEIIQRNSLLPPIADSNGSPSKGQISSRLHGGMPPVSRPNNFINQSAAKRKI